MFVSTNALTDVPEVGVVEVRDELVVFLSRARFRQEPLATPGREQYDGVAEVYHRHPPALGEAPTVTDPRQAPTWSDGQRWLTSPGRRLPTRGGPTNN